MNQKNVGDSVRAGCGDKPHVRFGRLRHEVASVAVGTESSGPNPMFCHRYPTKTCAWSNLGVGSSWDNEASPDKGGDSTVRHGRTCYHQSGRYLRSNKRVNERRTPT